MATVVDGANEATSLMDSIAAAASEQADSIQSITSAIDQISSVVQTNAATAEESAAASEELNAQAQIMKEAVQRFQLRSQT